MADIKEELNNLATTMADEQIKNQTIIPEQTLTDALTRFEQDAPVVETVNIGGLTSINAVTQRLQMALPTLAQKDGNFGPRTATELLKAMDENNLDIADYPTLDGFLEEQYPELRTEFTNDQSAEIFDNAQARDALIASMSTELSAAFNDTKSALLGRYFDKDALRVEIESHIDAGLPREEITEQVMEDYKEIMAALPDAIKTEIQDILEGDNVDIDGFALEQIQETFDTIDADAAALQQQKPETEKPQVEQWKHSIQSL